MKYLTLLRHAKSSWDHAGLSDHERPLNDRGNRDAPRVARALAAAYAERGVPLPQRALVSSACRTRETADLVLPEMASAQLQIRDELYLASAGEMMRILAAADEQLSHVLLIAHNPGTGTLADLLATDRPLHTFPTCCAVVLRFDIDFWGLLEAGAGQRLEVIIPRELSE